MIRIIGEKEFTSVKPHLKEYELLHISTEQIQLIQAKAI